MLLDALANGILYPYRTCLPRIALSLAPMDNAAREFGFGASLEAWMMLADAVRATATINKSLASTATYALMEKTTAAESERSHGWHGIRKFEGLEGYDAIACRRRDGNGDEDEVKSMCSARA